MTQQETNFAFEKKLGITSFYKLDEKDMKFIINAIERLLFCMKETNKLHGKTCEFFRLDFRQMYLDEALTAEFPRESFVFHLKWGDKNE